jgi:hypothetical protein
MSNKKFIVMVREVHVVSYAVEAEDVDGAVEAATGCGVGEELNVEYSHTLNTDTWTVEDESGNMVKG